MTDKPAILVILPGNEVHFKGGLEKASTTKLSLKNTSENQWIAFKLKAIDPNRYVVKPIQGIIEPGHRMTVTITMRHFDSLSAIETFLATRQLFMVQWIALPEQPTEPAAALLKSGQIEEIRLPCRFDQPSPFGPSPYPVSPCTTSKTGQTDATPGKVCHPGGCCLTKSIFALAAALVAMLIAIYVTYTKMHAN